MPPKKEYIEEEVLDKAMTIFWRNDYEAALMWPLEKGVGINQFSIHANFKSKNRVLIEVLKHNQKKVYMGLLSALEHADGGLSEIKSVFYRFVDFVKVDNKVNAACLQMLDLNCIRKMGKWR